MSTRQQLQRLFGGRSDFVDRLVAIFDDDIRAKIGFSIVSVFVLAAVFAPELAPHDPMAQDFSMLQPPSLSGENLLGTDSYGRDLLSRLMYGSRISLAIGLAATTFGATLGIVIGVVAGYFGEWVDDALMRMVDVMWAFPWLLIAILLVAIFGQSYVNVVVAIGFAYIDDFARLARGEVLSVREEDYITAAKSIGLGNYEIMFKEMLPNILAPLIVQFTVFTARAILAESTLSFLGLGVNPSTPTWGALLGQGRAFMSEAWWISFIPGIVIVVTVLGINLFGDALRDAFDVKEA